MGGCGGGFGEVESREGFFGLGLGAAGELGGEGVGAVGRRGAF